MILRRLFLLAPLFMVAALAQCGGGDSTGPSSSSCGGGHGSSVAFCRQVNNYDAGYGVEGQDFIQVTCIVGPAGATVSNAMNGTYSCGGTYKLTTFATAEIALNWGGSTSFTEHQSFNVPARGSGTFSITVTKLSGGSGNLFFSMSSGSNWMFDAIPLNTNCPSAGVAAAPAGRNSGVLPVAPLPDSLGVGAIRKFLPRGYDASGHRLTGG